MSACRKRNAPGTSGSRSTNSPSRSHASESDAAAGRPSSTSRMSAPENDDARAPTPSEATPGRRARAGRFGSRRVPRPSLAAPRRRRSLSPTLASSRRKSGLPAARSMSAATLVRQAPVARCGDGQSSRVVLRQRLQPQRQGRKRRGSRRRGEAALARAPRRAGEPRSRRELGAEISQQLGRGVVHPVDVVDHQERRRVEEVPEQRPHDAVQARAPERGVEVVHLGCRRDVHVQVRPRAAAPTARAPGRSARSRSLRVVRLCSPAAVQLDVEQRAQEGPERVVGRRRLVLLAAQLDLLHVGAGLPELLARDATFRFQARRPARREFRSPSAPARPTRRAPRARARGRRTGGPPASVPAPAARAPAAGSPKTYACTGSLLPFSVSGSSSVASNDPPPRPGHTADTQISSSPARAIRRAASAAVSPSTVYVRRKLAPT